MSGDNWEGLEAKLRFHDENRGKGGKVECFMVGKHLLLGKMR